MYRGGRDLWAGGPHLAARRLGAMPEEALWLQACGETAMVLGEFICLLAESE